MGIRILSTASTLPERIVTNAEMEKIVDTSDEWITKMTGMKERHFLSGSESFIGCVFETSKNAIAEANLVPNDIDLIIIGTSTPEQIMPSTASILQGMLGIKNCIAFDLQAACSGFVYALTSAYYFMQANPAINKALVLGADALSKVLDWKDRTTCVLFGDGFGGVVIGRDANSKGILFCELGCDGAGKEHLEIPWGVAQGMDKSYEENHYLIMNGREVFKNSVTYFTQIIQSALEKNHYTIDDIDWIIPHQANARIIQSVAERLNLPAEKLVTTLDKHSNTSAASIPLALDCVVKEGKIKRGDKLMLVGFGAGYTWGVVILEY